jgi:hypothetical protein
LQDIAFRHNRPRTLALSILFILSYQCIGITAACTLLAIGHHVPSYSAFLLGKSYSAILFGIATALLVVDEALSSTNSNIYRGLMPVLIHQVIQFYAVHMRTFTGQPLRIITLNIPMLFSYRAAGATTYNLAHTDFYQLVAFGCYFIKCKWFLNCLTWKALIHRCHWWKIVINQQAPTTRLTVSLMLHKKHIIS